jgi:hypothetical protein
LIRRQCFGALAEALALQFLVDLLQPLNTRTFRQQLRLKRAGIIQKRVPGAVMNRRDKMINTRYYKIEFSVD